MINKRFLKRTEISYNHARVHYVSSLTVTVTGKFGSIMLVSRSAKYIMINFSKLVYCSIIY